MKAESSELTNATCNGYHRHASAPRRWLDGRMDRGCKEVVKAAGVTARHLEALLHTIAVAHNRHGGARRASGIPIDAVRAMSRTSRARAVPVVARANCFYSGGSQSKRYASCD